MNVILEIMEKLIVFPSEILSSYNFLIGIFTLESKLSELYSDCVNEFYLYRTCIRQKQHIRPLNIIRKYVDTLLRGQH